jgi:hypothetical protein
MYLFTGREQVIYGHWPEYMAVTKEMQEYARAKGYGDFTTWVPMVGVNNESRWGGSYATLAEFETAMNSLQADEAFGALFRKQGSHIVQGSASTELLTTLD